MSAPKNDVAAVAQLEIAVKDEVKVEGEGDVTNGLQEDVTVKKPLWDLKFGVESDSTLLEPPPEVERRIKALKKLQVEFTQIESNYFQEVHGLEAKYAPLYTKFYERRHEITSGQYEPTDEECQGVWDAESESEEKKKEESKPEAAGGEEKTTDSSSKVEAPPASGVPDFWLHVLTNVDRLAEMIHTSDEPVFKHLIDITTEVMTEPMGFKLLFHFSPNEYFTNSVLTKSYEMKCEVDPQDPFGFEGPEIVNCSGCTIDWKEGKNVTVRIVQKKQKHKQSGAVRLVKKEETNPSFFEFFNPPQIPKEGTEDEDVRDKLTMDFEIGQYIRDRIIPRAVLYYTGEALEYDSSDLEEEDDDDDDDDDDNDDDGSRTTDDNDEAEGRIET